MPWLRLDDTYDTHPKLLELSEQTRWRWTRALLYCARHRTGGFLSRPTIRDLGLSNSVGKLVDLGLLSTSDDGYLVHDWDAYNPKDATSAERQARWRARNASRNAGSNGERNAADRHAGVSESVSRAQARARGPVPSLERDESLSGDVTLDDDEEHERRMEWRRRADAPDVRSPAAFIRAGIDSGEWPDRYVELHDAPRVNAPVTVEVCPECDCSPPLHAADCSLRPSDEP
jgi:hypothetical protein